MRPSVVEAGRRPEWTRGIVNPPVWRASTVLYDSIADMRDTGRGDTHHQLYYGRRGTPTQWALADALTELEPGAEGTFLYCSGVAAIAAALLSVLSPGDELLLVDSAYEPTRAMARGLLKRFGITTRFYDPLDRRRDRRSDRSADEGDLPGKPRQPDVRGAGRARDRRRGQGAGHDDDPRQHLGDAAVFPRDRQGCRPVDPRVHQICRRPFGRDAGIGHGRARPVSPNCATSAFSSARSPAPTIAGSVRAGCARWRFGWRSIRRAHSRWRAGLPSDPRSGACCIPRFPTAPAMTCSNAISAARRGCSRSNSATARKPRAPRSSTRCRCSASGSAGAVSKVSQCPPIRCDRTGRPAVEGALVRLHIGLEDPRDLIADLEAAFAIMSGAAR